MNIMELGAIGELVGGVAVIGSLVFVGAQIRQSTRTLRTTSFHQAVDPLWRLSEQVSGDTRIARIVRMGLTDEEPLEIDESYQFENWASSVLFAYENLYRSFEAEQIDEDALLNATDSGLFLLGQPGMLRRARVRLGPTSKRFFAFLEGRIRSQGSKPEGAHTEA